MEKKEYKNIEAIPMIINSMSMAGNMKISNMGAKSIDMKSTVTAANPRDSL